MRAFVIAACWENLQAFSINYADVCIRWGLYESALRFVGWPIVPGFDLAGARRCYRALVRPA